MMIGKLAKLLEHQTDYLVVFVLNLHALDSNPMRSTLLFIDSRLIKNQSCIGINSLSLILEEIAHLF